ncbi:DUF3592 domain-containing protein [Undibacterium sp. TS12]|uniref:DUF3592 domain-containing protein n=1 Tax=Undibacterium sp. TS12 TaxID=2908202 RepID=UPI001F4C78BE|nr:DUF3592 domain-containing protein [Undibacterium sp. TS12]MCH8619825.1 DUF3592 domain-containing protein [Undibacterium sp. TS12]
MIVRTLVIIFALFSLYLGVDNLQKFNAMRISADEFEQVEGAVVLMVHEVDNNPGYVVNGSYNKQLIQITYSYDFNGTERSSDSISPICSRCEAHHVFRMTGKKPSELLPGTPLKVYVLKSDPGKSYLALPTSGEKQSQMWTIFLWLIFAPAMCLLFYKLEGSGKRPDDTGGK